jgi:predicted lactoylglutathione lyase
LYVLRRTTGNPELVKHYKRYCKILSDTIKLAKKLHYNNFIINSKNKTKTTWDVIRSVTNSKSDKNIISSVSTGGKKYDNPQTMANIFNNHFIMPSNQIQSNIPTNVSNFLSYLFEVYKQPFPNIKMTTVTRNEIKDITKSLRWKNSKGYDEIP